MVPPALFITLEPPLSRCQGQRQHDALAVIDLKVLLMGGLPACVKHAREFGPKGFLRTSVGRQFRPPRGRSHTRR